jgi:hypothetical protein
MSKHVIDYRPGGVVEHLHDGNVITVSQEVDAVIKHCQAQRAVNDRLRGFRKPKTYQQVAEIPLALVEVLKAQGIDVLNDPEAMRRVLNDSAFAAFRTCGGKV